MASEITLRDMNKFHFCHHCPFRILWKPLRRTNDYECTDCECDSGYCKLLSESNEDMSGMTWENPVRAKKKIHEKEGEKLAATVTNNGKIQLGTDGDVSDFFTGTEESKMLSN